MANTPWRQMCDLPDGFMECLVYKREKKKSGAIYRPKVAIRVDNITYHEIGLLRPVLERRPDYSTLNNIQWFHINRYKLNTDRLKLLGGAGAGDSGDRAPAASGGLQIASGDTSGEPGNVQESAVPPLHGQTANGDYIRGKVDLWTLNNYFHLKRHVPDEQTSQVNASSTQATPPSANFLPYMEKPRSLYARMPIVSTAADCAEQVKAFTLQLATRRLPIVDQRKKVLSPEKPFVCKGNVVFHCPQGVHKNDWCPDSSTYWTPMHQALRRESYDKRHKRRSLKKYSDKLQWKVSPFAGALEVIASKSVVYEQTYTPTDGPTCICCERRVSGLENATPPTCKSCSERITTNYYPLAQEYINGLQTALIAKQDARKRCSQTSLFLTARKSGKSDALDADIFDAVFRSVRQSEKNPGVFGTTNRPGFPMPMKLIGKFASAANARSPIYRMTRRTVDQPADILPLSMLSDIIVAGYHPGDVVLIAMSHPTNFAIAQRDVEAFIHELFARGIPKSALYFYYYGLAISQAGYTKKYETVVSASELRDAILEGMPRYGLRPRVSAVLFAMERGVFERKHMSKRGRNTLSLHNLPTASQFAMVYAKSQLAGKTQCSLRECKQLLGKSFAVQCRQCPRWYHGTCVQLTAETAQCIDKQMLEWICRHCYLELLLDAKDWQRAVDLAVKHRDFSHYKVMFRLGAILRDWVKLITYCFAFEDHHKGFYTHALIATAKGNDLSAFKTLLRKSGQLTRGDVNDLVKYFTHGKQINDIFIELLANVDEDNISTPLLGTPNNSPLLGERRGLEFDHRRTVNSLYDKTASLPLSSSSTRLAYVSPTLGARTSSHSPHKRLNSHLSASPLLSLAIANSQTEEHQSTDLSPSMGAPSQSPLIRLNSPLPAYMTPIVLVERLNSHLPRSPLLSLAIANSQTERMPQSDVLAPAGYPGQSYEEPAYQQPAYKSSAYSQTAPKKSNSFESQAPSFAKFLF